MLSRVAAKVLRFWNRHADMERRVTTLETAVRCLGECPSYEPSSGTGLNGQRVRKQIFADLLATLPFDAIVETGTWMGDTAGYLATTTNVPVYSCELDRTAHAIAKLRLARLSQVHLERGDSRAFLRGLSSRISREKRCLFYLDAHWHSDLPLGEELGIIAEAWRDYVIVVDDFRVPGDEGYDYDSYGRGKRLSIEDFRGAFLANNLTPFFPAVSSAEETGSKRGCVVLAPVRAVDTLRGVRSIVEHKIAAH
jgi:hypothetical protein